MWLTMEKLSGFIMKFFKKHSRGIQVLFYQTSMVFIGVFGVYFGVKIW